MRTATLALLASAALAADPELGKPEELATEGPMHDVMLSSLALSVDADGKPVLAWLRKTGEGASLVALRSGSKPARVNPDGIAVASAHQAPGIARGPKGELYLTWSSVRKEGGSDLRLSKSVDGGKSWGVHLRVNADRPVEHSFEAVAASPDGTVTVSWLDARDGWDRMNTWSARIVGEGTKVEGERRIDELTCPCCRIEVAAGPDGKVAVLFRDQTDGDIRDMTVSISTDGGASFASPRLVHRDAWSIQGCPHRGGSAAFDADGRLHVAWYTEGADGIPRLRYAVSKEDSFETPVEVCAARGSLPDQVRLAVDPAGRIAVLWQDATSVRRRIVVRTSTDHGKSFGPVVELSSAMKCEGADIAALADGGFRVAWVEERWPSLVIVSRSLRYIEAK